jgi:hypothetical protein
MLPIDDISTPSTPRNTLVRRPQQTPIEIIDLSESSPAGPAPPSYEQSALYITPAAITQIRRTTPPLLNAASRAHIHVLAAEATRQRGFQHRQRPLIQLESSQSSTVRANDSLHGNQMKPPLNAYLNCGVVSYEEDELGLEIYEEVQKRRTSTYP